MAQSCGCRGAVWGEAPEPTAKVDIYNLKGARIRTLATGPEGTRFTWDGRDRRGRPVAPGVYWVRSQGVHPAWARKITVLP